MRENIIKATSSHISEIDGLDVDLQYSLKKAKGLRELLEIPEEVVKVAELTNPAFSEKLLFRQAIKKKPEPSNRKEELDLYHFPNLYDLRIKHEAERCMYVLAVKEKCVKPEIIKLRETLINTELDYQEELRRAESCKASGNYVSVEEAQEYINEARKEGQVELPCIAYELLTSAKIAEKYSSEFKNYIEDKDRENECISLTDSELWTCLGEEHFYQISTAEDLIEDLTYQIVEFDNLTAEA